MPSRVSEHRFKGSYLRHLMHVSVVVELQGRQIFFKISVVLLSFRHGFADSFLHRFIHILNEAVALGMVVRGSATMNI